MEQIILSISMLASNRTDTIRRTLDSLKPIMKQIPSELILVDTSTDPEVASILSEYTNQVIKFQWVNDFSAARNIGLQAAKGEWFLYIDDDEWFVEIDELVHFFKSGEYKEYGIANYIQRNFHDPEWLHYSDVWVSRMIKRNNNTRFCSKIHEYLYPVYGKCKNLKLIANHTGYIVVTEEDKLKKYKRNSVLLQEMIEEEPMRLRWRVQLAQEYWAVQKWKELLECCLENIEYTKARRDEEDCINIGTFYGGAIEALVYLKRFEEAKELGKRVLENSCMTELCKAYVHLRLGAIAMKEKQWKEAKHQIETYFIIRDELVSQEEKYANQKGALIIDETFESVSDKKAYSILIACGLAEGNTILLKQYFDKLEWNQKVIYVFENVIPVFFEAMADLPYEPIFGEVMQCLWRNKELQNFMCLLLADIERDEEKFENIKHILQQVNSNYWYIWYHKNQIRNNDGKPEGITLEQWEAQIQEYLRQAQIGDIRRRTNEIKSWEINQNPYGEVLEILLAKRVAYNSFYHTNAWRKERDILFFVKQTNLYIHKYFREEVIQDYPELLPVYGQEALKIENIMATEMISPAAAMERVIADKEGR